MGLPRGSSHQTEVWLGWVENSGQVLWVVLDTDIEWMIFELNNFHTLSLIVLSDEAEPLALEILNPFGVDLISMSVTLMNFLGTTVKLSHLGPLSILLEVSWAETKSHGSSQVSLGNLRHEDNDWVWSVGDELNGMGVLKIGYIASVLNDGDLHTKTDTEVWDLVGTSPVGGEDHSLSTTESEPTRNENTAVADVSLSYFLLCKRSKLTRQCKHRAMPCGTWLEQLACSLAPNRRHHTREG